MRKQKFSVKLITLLMACLVTMTSVPVHIASSEVDGGQSIAADASTDNTNIDIDNQSGTGEYTDTDVFIVEEDVSKRGEFEKHYLCSDGTYISVSYAEAIHYLDDKNTWKDVDQTLVLDTKTGTYKNGESDFEVCFSEKASSSDMVSISKGEHTLSWGLATKEKLTLETQTNVGELTKVTSVDNVSDKVTISPSSAKIASKPALSYSKASERLISSEDSFALPNASSQITYDDIILGDQNISVQYTVFQNKIEEDIIIYNRSDIDSVSMNMDVGSLAPVVNSDKSVDFVDDENIMQFHIDIPYMIDADMNVCNDIEVIAQKNGNSCTITYIPNKEWFDSEERVFPIVLDPAVTTNDYASSIEDTYVEENSTAIHTSEQYLLIANNGENRRKAIVRITKLPMIDDSMPIISGELTLFCTYSPFVDTQIKVTYCNLSSELEALNYEYVSTCQERNNDLFVTQMLLPVGSTKVRFDVTNNIYQMYSNEDDFDGNSTWNGSDFVIEYSSEEEISIYPFYSSEYTDKSYRPTLTVRYGYSIPAGMLNGEIYSFQNAASGAFMSVLSDNPNARTNIFQKNLNYDSNTYKNDISTLQQFKLEYVPSTGGYLLRPIASMGGNGLVVEVDNPSLTLLNGANVQLYSRDAARMQEWLIVPYNDAQFRILPRAQMSLALMSAGYNDGSNSYRGSSNGNIYVQRQNVNNDFQLWFIYDENADLVDSQFRSAGESGNYFITNSFSGKYLHNAGTTLNCVQGRISDLGYSTVNWKIVNLGDGYCTIQRSDVPGWYLSPTSVSGGISVRFVHLTSDTIPDAYKWELEIDGSCVTIRHKVLGYYLYDMNSNNVWLRPKYTQGTQDYERQKWRFADEDTYRELESFNFADMVLDKGESSSSTVSIYPYRATWSDLDDFWYTGATGAGCVDHNLTNNTFKGLYYGTATMTVQHKTTGITDTFNISVNPTKAIIIIPGIMGTELVASDNNSQYPENTKLWSYDLFDGFENLDIVDAVVEAQNIAYKIQSLECNNNGASINGIKPYNGDNSYGTGDSYKKLYEKLSLEYSDQYSIDFFAYDWRKSNDFSAQLLNIYIESKDYDKVFLVAHSMGGLVASGYLALGESRRNKVEGLVMLGSPLLGTPSAPYIFGSEDVITLMGYSDIPTEIINMINVGTYIWDPLGAIVDNFTSIYELFPSEKYFDNLYGGKTYLRTKLTSQSVEHLTYSESLQYYDILSNSYNASLMVKAGEFHNSLYVDGVHVTERVDTYYIAGYGIDTTEVVSYESGEWISNSCQEGDSLVPIWSATLGDRQPNKTIYAENVNHMGLIKNEECLDYIVELIKGNSSLVGFENLKQEISSNE